MKPSCAHFHPISPSKICFKIQNKSNSSRHQSYLHVKKNSNPHLKYFCPILLPTHKFHQKNNLIFKHTRTQSFSVCCNQCAAPHHQRDIWRRQQTSHKKKNNLKSHVNTQKTVHKIEWVTNVHGAAHGMARRQQQQQQQLAKSDSHTYIALFSILLIFSQITYNTVLWIGEAGKAAVLHIQIVVTVFFFFKCRIAKCTSEIGNFSFRVGFFLEIKKSLNHKISEEN